MCVFSYGVSKAPILQQASQMQKMDSSVEKARKEILESLGVSPVPFNIGRAFQHAGASLGIGAAAGVGLPVAGTAGLTAVGFTSSGIAAGSAAAGIQSSIGIVSAGSTFATLQSIGATGGLAILGPVGLIAAALSTVVAVATFVGIGIHKHVKEIDSFIKTPVILIHI